MIRVAPFSVFVRWTLFLALVLAISIPAQALDEDADGIPNEADNCLADANENQLDSDSDGFGDVCDNCPQAANGPLIPDAGGVWQLDEDADGYGNACDADYDNNGGVGVSDFLIFNSAFGAVLGDSNFNARTDFDGDDVIGVPDYIFFSIHYGGTPGPSGLPCAATTPCLPNGPFDNGRTSPGSLTLRSDFDPNDPNGFFPFHEDLMKVSFDVLGVSLCTDPDPINQRCFFDTATLSNEPGAVVAYNNGSLVPPQDILAYPDRIELLNAAIEGRNEIGVSTTEQFDRGLSTSAMFFGGTQEQVDVTVVDESMIPVENAVVKVTVGSDPMIGYERTTDSNGLAVFRVLPPRTMRFEAMTTDGRIGVAVTMGGSGPLALSITAKGVDTPSPIDNNDFSLGLAGWESSPGAADIIPHVE